MERIRSTKDAGVMMLLLAENRQFVKYDGRAGESHRTAHPSDLYAACFHAGCCFLVVHKKITPFDRWKMERIFDTLFIIRQASSNRS